MLADYPVFYVARLVLETRTPLSITTGRGNGVFDALLMRDANHLPAIPGAAFAGVLRHLYQRAYGEAAARTLFGYARRDNQQSEDLDRPSQVHVSWGCLHDSNDRPVSGLLTDPQDVLLADTPVVRQHVRLTGRGAAAESGQFDRSALRAGHRFTIELSLWSDQVEDPRWQALLDLLGRPGFRLGGATRRGLGALRIERLYEGRFYLKKLSAAPSQPESPLLEKEGLPPESPPLEKGGQGGFPPESPPLKKGGQGGFSKTPCHLLTNPPQPSFSKGGRAGYGDLAAYSRFQAASLQDHPELREIPRPESQAGLHADIYLTPCDGYRFGQGSEPLVRGQEEAKLLSVREKRVVWQDGHGAIAAGAELVIPASSVKGALSHRLAFHHNALCGRFADSDAKPAWERDENPAVRALFGYAKDDNATHSGQAGCVLLDDLYLLPDPAKALVRMHNGIDRFTGGVRQHVLFGEELVGQQDVLQLRLTLLHPHGIGDSKIRQALQRTLADLSEGRLALGAGGGRGGHGFFSGAVVWSDGEQWIQGGDS